MSAASWTAAKEAFAEAAQWFVRITAQAPGRWDEIALGEWTVRDLVGHTSRALLTVESYLGRRAVAVEIASPVEYFRAFHTASGGPAADPAAVAERGRAAGRALGSEAAAEVDRIAQRVLARVDGAAANDLVDTPVGGMRLVDYLPTRTVELTVHTCDLAAALGEEMDVPDSAAMESLTVLGELAVRGRRAAPLLLATTGRGGLPADFTVL
jgi:hypothetical protein